MQTPVKTFTTYGNRFSFYEVGGCIRDELLGVPYTDVDFSVVAHQHKSSYAAFSALGNYLTACGFQVFKASAAYLTLRAKIPSDIPLASRTRVADFVLARKDGTYKDGRRPESVKLGSLEDDLKRRDFTVNALAKTVDTSKIIDLVSGLQDIKTKTLRFVGDPEARVAEDGLRVLRALRFTVTKGFKLAETTERVIYSELATKQLELTKIDRIREELTKMFFHDAERTTCLLAELPPKTRKVIYREGLWLLPTTQSRPPRAKDEND